MPPSVPPRGVIPTLGHQGLHSTLHLPRILCLHGGGTNARIFTTQCRVLRAALAPYFRLVFAEGPFSAKPGPDVLSVYEDWGPFKSWLRLTDGDAPGMDAQDINKALEDAIESAMITDDSTGATGNWVGLLGFSQGAKIAASLLLRQQTRTSVFGRHRAGSFFLFAVLLAGRAPLVALDQDLQVPGDFLADPSERSTTLWSCEGVPQTHRRIPSTLYSDSLTGIEDHVLDLPTIHVHGTRDLGLEEHRKLLAYFCRPQNATLVEWDGDHRIPIKTDDVRKVVDEILEVAKTTGII